MRQLITDKKLISTIKKASGQDPFDLALQLKKLTTEERRFITLQVGARRKAEKKIPEFLTDDRVMFPSVTAVEQSSSSITAGYKASLIRGGCLVDMTGGLGVDASYFSKRADKVIYIEKDPLIAEYASHNFGILKPGRIEVIRDNSVEYVRKMKIPVKYIYLDPSRRSGARRVYRMEESEPDPVAIQHELLEKAEKVILKLSPYLDINHITAKFRKLNQIHVVATGGECREILVILDNRESSSEPRVVTRAYESTGIQEFISTRSENQQPCRFGFPGRFIFDPNVAIRKSGMFNSVGRHFDLVKLAPNSHLYTHDQMIAHFPGRVFELERTLKFRDFLNIKTLGQANIATRNFRLKPEEIRKRTGIREGGEVFAFCTTDLQNKQVVLITRKADGV